MLDTNRAGITDGQYLPCHSPFPFKLETKLIMSRIRVRQANHADIPDIVEVHFGAFGPNVMNILMNPGGPTAEAKAKFGETLFPAPGDTKPGAEIQIFVAELHPEPGQVGDPKMIAFAKWLIYRN